MIAAGRDRHADAQARDARRVGRRETRVPLAAIAHQEVHGVVDRDAQRDRADQAGRSESDAAPRPSRPKYISRPAADSGSSRSRRVPRTQRPRERTTKITPAAAATDRNCPPAIRRRCAPAGWRWPWARRAGPAGAPRATALRGGATSSRTAADPTSPVRTTRFARDWSRSPKRATSSLGASLEQLGHRRCDRRGCAPRPDRRPRWARFITRSVSVIAALRETPGIASAARSASRSRVARRARERFRGRRLRARRRSASRPRGVDSPRRSPAHWRSLVEHSER